jgi:PKD repeat protein
LAGIKLNFEEVQEALMINFDWYQADFDIWVWSWYWGPEPLSNLAVFRTQEVTTGGDSTVGPIGDWWWVNEGQKIAQSEYDVVFEQALRTLDRTERKACVDELQVMIYDEYVEFPPLHTVGLYAWTESRFVGWGDWENHTARTIISDMPWLWYDLEPAGTNSPPIFNTPLYDNYEAALDVPITFTIGVSDPDGDPLEVNWSFGDGSPFAYDFVTEDTTVEQIVQRTHTYTETSNGLTLRVALSDGQHVYEVVDVAEVSVADLSNTPPVAVFTVTPEMGYVETVFKMNATTSHDGEDSVDSLEVRWDFDGDDSWDTDWTTEKVAYHQYPVPGDYTVKLEVRDTQGLTDSTTMQVEVCEVIPEFPFIIVPVLSIMLLMLLATRSRLRRSRSLLRRG